MGNGKLQTAKYHVTTVLPSRLRFAVHVLTAEEGILYFEDWTGLKWTRKTRTGKTRTGKTRTSKTRTGKTRTSKTRTSKTRTSKTRTSKTQRKCWLY